MPVSVSYPGVYVEELPSGVRTIAGVATSITAFVGKARARARSNEPVTITSFGDFERALRRAPPRLHARLRRARLLPQRRRAGGHRAALQEAERHGRQGELRDRQPARSKPPSKGRGAARCASAIDKKAATDPNLVAVAARLGRRAGRRVRCHRPRRRHRPHRDVPQPDDEGERAPRRPRARRTSRPWSGATQGRCRQHSTPGRARRRARPTPTSGPTTPSPRRPSRRPRRRGGRQRRARERRLQGIAVGKTGVYAAREDRPLQPALHPADARDGDVPDDVYQEALSYCAKRRAVLIVDPKAGWTTRSAARRPAWPAWT